MAYALSGSGTSSDPYRISSVEDWNSCQAFTNVNYDRCFILTADLTVSQMISTGAPYFAGVFDGNGHTLTFNMSPTTSSCAPFNHVVKKNLKVKGEIVVSEKYAGGIIANVDARDNGCVTIQNCISSVFCRPGCYLSNCYYTQSFGETIQGESAKKMSDTDLGNAFGHGDGADKNWKLHCDTLYLNTVKATVPSGTKVENSINNSWPAWESTMNFCVYDAPKPIERNYDPK